MSTPTQPTVVVETQQAVSWLKQHETIILGLFVLVIGLWGFNKWVEKSANDANAQVVISKQNQAVQDAQVKTLETQLATQSQQFTQAQLQMHQEIAGIVAAIAQRDAQASTKVAEIKTATPPQVIADVQSVYTLPNPLTPTADGADATTADLQQFAEAKVEGDAAKADLKDTQSELQATASTLQQSQDLNLTKDNIITNLHTDLTKHDATCEDEKKQMKADARKGKMHAFVAGAIIVGSILIRFVTF